MKCTKCQKEVTGDHIFCPYCGEKLPKENISNNEGMIFEECKKEMADEIDHENKTSESSVPKNLSMRKHRQKADDAYLHNSRHSSTDASVQDGKRSRGEKNKLQHFGEGILISLLIISTVVLAVYFSYSHFTGIASKEYIKEIAGINDQISKANNEMASILGKDDKTLPAGDISSKADSLSNTFGKILSEMNDITPPAKYSSLNNDLKDTISRNKEIYEITKKILDAPTGSDADNDLKTLRNTVDQCMNSYTSIRLSTISFSLPDSISGLPPKIGEYVDQKKSDFAKASALIDVFSDYFNDISKLVLSYDSDIENMDQVINNARTFKTMNSWNALYSLISKNRKAVNNIKSEYYNISVPSYLKSFNSEFSGVISDTLSYYSKLRLAAQTEQNFKAYGFTYMQISEQTKKFDKLYNNADSYRSSAAEKYHKFTIDMNTQKNKYLNADYVVTLTQQK